VRVTHAHYVALQERLEAVNSNRDSKDYNGTDYDILSVKLEFLRSLPPAPAEASSQPHPDDSDNGVDNGDGPESSNDDDAVLESLFPSILEFLDLSSLGLKETMSTRFPLPLLIREEYRVISGLVKNEPRNMSGSVVVSGQPGTGEFLVSVSHRI
jgi:hypothetical protein